METSNQKIKFYEKRNFSEKMSATFDFVRINIKSILKLCLYIILPLALIQGIFMNSYMALAISPDAVGSSLAIAWKSLLFGILALVIGFVVISIAFTAIQFYNEKGSLANVAIKDMKDRLLRNGLRAFGISIIIGLLFSAYIIVAAILAFVSPFLVILIILGAVVLAIPIMLAYPIFIFEDSSVGTAISKAFKLGFKTWGGLFALILVIGLLVGIIQGIGSLPWSILFFAKGLVSPGETMFFGESIIMYIASVFMLFLTYISSIILYIALSYHYSSVSEATEGTSINDDLEIFDQL